MTKAVLLIASLALLAVTMPVETAQAADPSRKDSTAAVEVCEELPVIEPWGFRRR